MTVKRVTQATNNLGRTVSYTYDAHDRLSTVTDPVDHVTTSTWDASNRLRTIKDGRDIVYQTNDYDGSGRVLTQTLADPNATYGFGYTIANGSIYTWNARNQLVALGGGMSATFAYDGTNRRRGKDGERDNDHLSV